MEKLHFGLTVLTVVISSIFVNGNRDAASISKPSVVFTTTEEHSQVSSHSTLEFLESINSSVAQLSNRVHTIDNESEVAALGPNSHSSYLQRKERQINFGVSEIALGKLEDVDEFQAGKQMLRAPDDNETSIIVVDISPLRTNIRNLTNDVLTEDEAKELIARFVTDYRVRLYSGENYTGDSKEYSFTTANNTGGCQPLGGLVGSIVGSVEHFGKCIRLFDEPACNGWSLAVYPGSANSWKASKLIKVFYSIGPCLSYEFQFDPAEGRVIKNSSDLRNYIPDLIEFSSDEKYANATEAENDPIHEAAYLLGPHKRVEFIRAWAFEYFPNITRPMTGADEMDFYLSLEKEPGDMLGYAIPFSIRMDTNEPYNVFPQSPSCMDEWLQRISMLGTFFSEKGTGGLRAAVVEVNFEYENESRTRPYAFYYHIAYKVDNGVGWTDIDAFYGRIVN